MRCAMLCVALNTIKHCWVNVNPGKCVVKKAFRWQNIITIRIQSDNVPFNLNQHIFTIYMHISFIIGRALFLLRPRSVVSLPLSLSTRQFLMLFVGLFILKTVLRLFLFVSSVESFIFMAQFNFYSNFDDMNFNLHIIGAKYTISRLCIYYTDYGK